MLAAFHFLLDNNLLTPGILAAALAAVTWQLNRSIREVQSELRVMAKQQNETATVLQRTVVLLDRIDKHGTESELKQREQMIGRWEAAHERSRG